MRRDQISDASAAFAHPTFNLKISRIAVDAIQFRARKFGACLGQIVLTHHPISLLDIGGSRKARHDQEFQSKIVIVLGTARAVSHDFLPIC
jgi:hypothetical protein